MNTMNVAICVRTLPGECPFTKRCAFFSSVAYSQEGSLPGFFRGAASFEEKTNCPCFKDHPSAKVPNNTQVLRRKAEFKNP
jgi:hypothetical protein